MSDPSVAVAEAFRQFSQATVSAVRAYEQGTRARLSQVEDDLRALRRERDDALRDLITSREQTQVWVAEVDKWKSEANRALVVNTHQAELINQLRQEAQQWKDQCLRLEETLRGEIKAWKDQFLRVDAEHTRLLNQQLSAPSSQSTFAQDSTPKRVPVPMPIPGAGGDSSATSSATKRASASSSTARVDKPAALHLPHPPTKATLPRVVRRVQAVIEVPVKEEDLSPERPDSVLLLHPPSTTRAGGVARRKSSASSRRVSRRVLSDASDSVGGGESRSAGGGGGRDEYVDEEEVENAIASSSPGVDGKAVPWGKKHIRHQPDEEDDELMMYATRNPHKVRLPHEIHMPRPPRPKSVTNVTASRPPGTDTPTQKRRNTDVNTGSIPRAKRRK